MLRFSEITTLYWINLQINDEIALIKWQMNMFFHFPAISCDSGLSILWTNVLCISYIDSVLQENSTQNLLSLCKCARWDLPIHDEVIKWKHFPRYWPFYVGNSPVPTQRPVTRSFDVFLHLRLNKRLSKQPRGWWFETPPWSLWRQCNVRQKNSPTCYIQCLSSKEFNKAFKFNKVSI